LTTGFVARGEVVSGRCADAGGLLARDRGRDLRQWALTMTRLRSECASAVEPAGAGQRINPMQSE